ncbi:hypothetical protein MMC30_006647 [Trapelia coarctata]|nr:hypothetical protein [Trapelia coarctata]
MALDYGTKKEILHDVSSEECHSLYEVKKHTEANILPQVVCQPDGKDLETAVSSNVTALGPMDPSSFPDGGLEAWLVVFGGFCCLFVSFGWINCIGVFQAYYQDTLLSSYKPSTVAWIPSIEVFMMFFLGPIFGFVCDSRGPRLLLLFGSFLHVFGLMMASISTSYYQILLSQGICSPIGSSAIFYAATCAVSTWFFHHRALALGIIAAGSGLGGMIFPILVEHLLPKIGFPWTMRVAAFLILALLVPAHVTVKSRLSPTPHPFIIRAFVKPLRELPFALMAIGSFFLFFSFFLPYNFVILQAEAIGMPQSLSTYLVVILNGSSIFGRTIPPYLADRLGRFNVMIITTLFTGIICLAIWLPSKSNTPIIVFAALYGFSSGALVSVAQACIGQIGDIRAFGLRNGVLWAITGIAALCGNPIGGALLTGGDGSFAHLQIFTGVMTLVGALGWVAARWRLVGWKIWEKV